MRIFALLPLLLHHVIGFAQVVPEDQTSNDPFFPAHKQFQASVLLAYSPVTPPPAIIADVTYGISKKFAAGLVGGTTGALAVYGIRLNAKLYEVNRFRGLFRLASLYYPERDGRFLFDRKNKYVMPWMLSMAVIDTEWRSKRGIRYSLGAGALETHCIDDMKMWFDPDHDHHALSADGQRVEESLIDVFMTVQVAVSLPLSKRFTLRSESFAVFRKGNLIEREKFKVTFPINTYAMIIYSF